MNKDFKHGPQQEKKAPVLRAGVDPDVFGRRENDTLGTVNPTSGTERANTIAKTHRPTPMIHVLEKGKETGPILFEVVQINTFGVSKKRLLLGSKEQRSSCVAGVQARQGLG